MAEPITVDELNRLDAEYSRRAWPVLLTYGRQVLGEVDLERMRKAAVVAGDVNRVALIDAFARAYGAFLDHEAHERKAQAEAQALTKEIPA